MATRSLIAVKNIDDTYQAVYCHWDGYPSGVGDTLLNYYTDTQKVQTLIENGDMSNLASTIEDCGFYTKRGESLRVSHYPCSTTLLKAAKNCGAEYIYTFKSDTWYHQKV
jgi:hypothetical protein